MTGAGGQLGRALAPALQGHAVTALARAALDVSDLAGVRAALDAGRPQRIVNASGWTDVDGAEADPEGAFRANAVGPRNLAIAAAERDIPLLHVSSDYVFDGKGSRPLREDDPTGPLSAYGRSKLAGEEAVREHQPRHFIVRTAWLFAATGKSFPNTLVSIADRPELRVVDDQHGSPTFAPHLAQAIARLLETERFGTWHLAGRGGTTWFGLARALLSAAGLPTPVVPVGSAEVPRAAVRPAYAVLTTMQDPPILLPPWEEGVTAWAEARRSLQGVGSSGPRPSR